MVDWATEQGRPDRIIDPGTGSARFLIRAAEKFADALLIGVETDPLAALIARANLNVLGLSRRARIVVDDYRDFAEDSPGKTLYIGNPPYVRHHGISPKWKRWLSAEAARLGHKASQLAGLHVYFFLATALRARPGDFGTFITASEWLDVNYGSLVRRLLAVELGGRSITVIEPTAQPFPDATTTAAITTFEIGCSRTSVFFKQVASLKDLESAARQKSVPVASLLAESRWSRFSLTAKKSPEGFVELGELCRVHRGQVTGSNKLWIAGTHSKDLPRSVLYPTITKAKELISANGTLVDSSQLRCVIDLPANLDELQPDDQAVVQRFLERARTMGGDNGYVASHRRAWWSVGLREPAPIVATYMARRAPAFVINKAGARHINIAHGLYPRGPMPNQAIDALARFLQKNVSQHLGRTYAGGLTKFEPREMERLLVPTLAMLSGVTE